MTPITLERSQKVTGNEEHSIKQFFSEVGLLGYEEVKIN